MQEEKQQQIPQHVAIIMDGNGRWAKLRGLERTEGHIAGKNNVHVIIKAACDMGIKFVTLYAFSTENWGRPKKEVDMLMELFCKSIISEMPELIENGVRVRIIGDKEGLSDEVCRHIDLIEEKTSNLDRLVLILALNYSSQTELTHAAREIAKRVERGELKAEEIDRNTIEESLYTNGIPAPDLVIRTSGECRLSNFLLWQSAYSELYFTPTLWPDFDKEELEKAVAAYNTRDRRYGLVKENNN